MQDSQLAHELQELCNQAGSFRKLLGRFSDAILTTTPHGRFAVPIEDRYIGWELRINGSYAADQLEYLSTVCSGTTRLLVVGAHVGALAIPLAKICHSVTAIEANPRTFEFLKLNVFLNELSNCRLICRAASDRVESLDFLSCTVNSGGSKRKPIEPWHYFFDNPEVIKVEAAPLDELLPDEVFEVIVMDIEGSEFFALKGMQRILSTARTLATEFTPHHLKYVAGVSAADFAATVAPHFSSMHIVGERQVLQRDRIASVLTDMFDRNEDDAGLVFSKA